jgi:hypothetical protein
MLQTYLLGSANQFVLAAEGRERGQHERCRKDHVGRSLSGLFNFGLLILHVLDFSTWNSLIRMRLSDHAIAGVW